MVERGDRAAGYAILKRLTVAAPCLPEVWLGFAYAVSPDPGLGMPPTAQAALERSYQLEPIALDQGLWRIVFIMERWRSAPPALRIAALRELSGLWFVSGLRQQLEHLTVLPEDQAARLAAALTIQRAKTRRLHQ